MTDANKELNELRKKVPYKKIDEKTLISGPCRCSFPHVFEMYKSTDPRYQDATPAYSIDLLIPKNDPFAKACMAMINTRMAEKYGADKSKWPDGWKKPMSDGDKRADKYPEMAGHYVIKCKSTRDQPLVMDQSKAEIMDARDIYPGCVVRAKFDSWVSKNFDTVGFGLKLVQKIADMEPFGGASAPETGDDLDDLDIPAAKSKSDDFDDMDF